MLHFESDNHKELIYKSFIDDCLPIMALYQYEPKRIDIVWNSRLTTTAGRAWWKKHKIELNPRLLNQNINEIIPTFKHELAHLIARHSFPDRPIKAHGIEFKTVLFKLGGKVERTHKMNVDGLIRQHKSIKYFLDCSCGIKYRLTKKQAKGYFTYYCRMCKAKLNNQSIYSITT